MRLYPGRDSPEGVWALQLSSPTGLAEDATASLFTTLADGFRSGGG